MEYLMSIVIVASIAPAGIFCNNTTVLEPPSNLQISSSTAVSLSLTWDVSSDYGDLQYYIHYYPDGEDHEEVNADAQPYEINNLEPDTLYMIMMYARNGSVNSTDTSVNGTTKGLPSSEDQYRITALATAVNVHIAFTNPDSVTQVNVSCCIGSVCSFTAEQTNGTENASLDVSYPDNINGIFNVTTYLYDGDTMVQRLEDFFVTFGPENVTVSETTSEVLLGNDSDTITCWAECYPACEFHWDTSPSTSGTDLTIHNTTKSDSREYTCTAVNGFGRSNASFYLDVVFGPENVTVSETTSEVLLGNNSDTITCWAECNPDCEFQWDTSDITNGTNLTIYNTTKSDSREYTCTAFNGFGRSNASFCLDVVFGPENVTVSETTSEVLLGNDSDTITCWAECNPDCEFQWDTTDIVNGSDLIIYNARKSDSREYTCTVSNKFGRRNASFYLDVVFGPENVTVSETISEVLLGNDSDTITCWAECNPDCEFQWNTTDITNGTNLTINNANKSDSRVYTCTASNDIGNSNAYFFLDVVYEPHDIHLNTTNTINGTRGGVLNVLCEADCNPVCKYTWTKDGAVMSNSSVLGIPNAQYDHIGEYICLASNPYGNDSTNVSVKVYGAPDPPNNITVTQTTAVSLNISWTFGWDGGHKRTYCISYLKDIVIIIDCEAEYCTFGITDLEPDTTYTIAMHAQSAATDAVILQSKVQPYPGKTKDLPCVGESAFAVEAHERHVHVNMTFKNPDSVTRIVVNCCIAEETDTCNYTDIYTHGLADVPINVPYPEDGSGSFIVTAELYDQDILVQELHRYTRTKEPVVPDYTVALIITSVFMGMIACVALVQGVVLFMLMQRQSQTLGNGSQSPTENQVSSNNGATANQQSQGDDVNDKTCSDESQPSTYNVDTGTHNPDKAKENIYDVDNSRPKVKPGYDNVNRSNDNPCEDLLPTNPNAAVNPQPTKDQLRGNKDSSGHTRGNQHPSGYTRANQNPSGHTRGNQDPSGVTLENQDPCCHTRGNQDLSGHTHGNQAQSFPTRGHPVQADNIRENQGTSSHARGNQDLSCHPEETQEKYDHSSGKQKYNHSGANKGLYDHTINNQNQSCNSHRKQNQSEKTQGNQNSFANMHGNQDASTHTQPNQSSHTRRNQDPPDNTLGYNSHSGPTQGNQHSSNDTEETQDPYVNTRGIQYLLSNTDGNPYLSLETYEDLDSFCNTTENRDLSVQTGENEDSRGEIRENRDLLCPTIYENIKFRGEFPFADVNSKNEQQDVKPGIQSTKNKPTPSPRPTLQFKNKVVQERKSGDYDNIGKYEPNSPQKNPQSPVKLGYPIPSLKPRNNTIPDKAPDRADDTPDPSMLEHKQIYYNYGGAQNMPGEEYEQLDKNDQAIHTPAIYTPML